MRLSNPEKQRTEWLLQEIFDHTFHLFDAEVEYGAKICGQIACAAEGAAERILAEYWDVDTVRYLVRKD